MNLDLLARPASATIGPRARWEEARSSHDDPVDALLLAAHGAHTAGEVFYAGYQCALALQVGAKQPGALLVTEPAGQHPRTLRAELRGGRITGVKTMALADVDRFFVVVSAGKKTTGEIDLRVVEVDVSAPGIHRERVELGLLEDCPHERVEFVETPVLRTTAFEAWRRVVRPFRDVEDAALALAFSASQVGEGSSSWLALATLSGALLRSSSDSTATVLAVDGVYHLLLRELETSSALPVGTEWKRFVTLLLKMRAARTAKAFERWRRPLRD